MIEITNQRILNSGWAGPLLWVVTDTGASIHLYDGEIMFDGVLVSAGDDLNTELCGSGILGTNALHDYFNIYLTSGKVLSISSESHETARVFIKGSGEPHHIYQNGVLFQEVE